jgi:cytochrome d ubiquinol oxidase subunit I
MNSALVWDRFQFAFTITYHYIFPQLTMGLSLMVFVLTTIGWRRGDQRYARSANFWARIFGISFAFGVVTGIPMEFQFGTNWARFSVFAGNVIGQPLAMEGVFAFFLESTFLGLFLYGGSRIGPRGRWVSSLLVFLGSWISGWFIVATNAWMQHPVAYTVGQAGRVELASVRGLLANPWLPWQYLHTMVGAVTTGAMVMAGVGAFYLLTGKHKDCAGLFVRAGVIAAAVSTVLLLFPTGDRQGRNIAEYQPITLAGMEGLFETQEGAPLALVGQPNMDTLRLDNPLEIPNALSFLTYRRWEASIRGLKSFSRDLWPDNVPLLYFTYHIMVGLGTVFIVAMLIALLMLWRGALCGSRPMLWALLVLTPFPFVANLAGWITAELGRQPWIVYGLLRTDQGNSELVSSGNTIFSLLGFMGTYALLSILFLYLMYHAIERGPEPAESVVPPPGPATAGTN